LSLLISGKSKDISFYYNSLNPTIVVAGIKAWRGHWRCIGEVNFYNKMASLYGAGVNNAV
jgi:hypothetical protein